MGEKYNLVYRSQVKLAREMTFALQSGGGAGFRQETSWEKDTKKRMQKGQEKGISCVQEGTGQVWRCLPTC